MCTGLTKAGPRGVNTFGEDHRKEHVLYTNAHCWGKIKGFIFGCPRHIQTHHGVNIDKFMDYLIYIIALK